MSVVVECAENLQRLPGVRHGFTTRAGGVSLGPLASLNLARRPGEQDAALVENWGRALAGVGFTPEQLALVEQVHGDAVLEVRGASGPLGVAGAADAILTAERGLVVAVRTADCVPVLLAVDGCVAAVHAGWRGVAANIVARAVEAVCARAGVAPGRIIAAVGPHIGAGAYEVSDEVLQAVARAGGGVARVRKPGLGQRDHVDLGAAVAWQLRAAGVVNIEALGLCTASDRRLFSHRRDGGDAGRIAAMIGLSL